MKLWSGLYTQRTLTWRTRSTRDFSSFSIIQFLRLLGRGASAVDNLCSPRYWDRQLRSLVYLPRMQSASVTMVSMVICAIWPVVMPTPANTTAHAWQRTVESSAAIVHPDIMDGIVSSAVRAVVLGRTAYNTARVQKVKILFLERVKICLCIKTPPWECWYFVDNHGYIRRYRYRNFAVIPAATTKYAHRHRSKRSDTRRRVLDCGCVTEIVGFPNTR